MVRYTRPWYNMSSPFKVIFVDILLYAETKSDLHRPPQVVHEPSSLGLQRPGTKDELLGEKKTWRLLWEYHGNVLVIYEI